MENSLRKQLEAQDFTVESGLQKDGEDKMKGQAVLPYAKGAQGCLACSAARSGTTFRGECHVPGAEAG